MELFFDDRDRYAASTRHDRRIAWLEAVGGKPLSSARPEDEGFVFAGCRPIDDYARLVRHLPRLGDRPDEREPLMRLDSVLDALAVAGVNVPTPPWRSEIRDASRNGGFRNPDLDWDESGGAAAPDVRPGFPAEYRRRRGRREWRAF